MVVSVKPITEKGESSGAGAVIGAIAGGLLGNQIGSCSGKDAATVGGAVAGNEIEKQRNAVTYYAVTVEMEDQSQRVANVSSAQGLSIGSKVEIIGEDLRLL